MTTISTMFRDTATRYASDSACMFRSGGGWAHMTYGEVARRVEAIGDGLLASGISKGDRIAILANTRVEWTLVDYAALGAGIVVVPIYQTNSPEECAYILADSNAKAVVCEDESQVAKIREIRGDLAALQTVIVIDGAPEDGVETLATIEARGAGKRGPWAAGIDAVDPNDLATLIYTSGTTGPPKGCVLTHRNFFASVAAIDSAGDDLLRRGDRLILFLPLAHILARVVQFSCAMRGTEIAYSSVPTIMDDLAEVNPTLLPSVPRVYEKAYTRIQGLFAEATGAKAKLISWAMGVGRRRNHYYWVLAKPVPVLLALEWKIAYKLVFSKIHARFGGNVRLAVSGGAPLSLEVQEFFLAAGIPILEGYGLTEATPLCVNLPNGGFLPGTIGKAIGDVELRLLDDGELLARSDMVFTEYYNNPTATAEARDADGWLHTGDIATIDDNGFVRIVDRKKDIIITAGGKNVAPQNIENALKATQYVSQALVYGDRKPYISALITLDPQEMELWAKANGAANDMYELVADRRVQKIIAEAIDHVNAQFGRVEQVKRYRILPVDFTQETGELTPSLKLKRRFVCDRYASYIDAMYADDAPDADVVTDRAIEDLQRQPVGAGS